MKKSNYNYIFHENGKTYWFNGLTKAFFKTSEGLGRKLESVLDTPSEIEQSSPDFFNRLKAGGFIIDKEFDELDFIRKINDHQVNKKDYNLMILPTLNCNFKCWYCIQDHIPSKMSGETMDRIKRHLEYMIEEEKIESLTFSWFGGEPFIYFKDVIKPLSIYAISLCEKAGIPFNNTATSNAALINKDIADELDDLRFTFFQITLDGVKTEHDKVKFSNGLPSAFEKTLSNINSILTVSELSRITLRINYTYEKLDSMIVDQVNHFIQQKHRDRVNLSLKKVWQEKADPSQFHKYLSLLKAFEQSGYNVIYLDIITDFIPCYVNRKYFNTINYNGNVVKCTANNDIYKDTTPGKLLDNGKIEWKNEYDTLILEKSFENQECLSCRKLPICMGNCARHHYEGNRTCKFKQSDIDYKSAIIELINKTIDN